MSRDITHLDATRIIPFQEKDLVSFGNYLLSKARMKKVSKEMREHVTHADLENWKELKEKK